MITGLSTGLGIQLSPSPTKGVLSPQPEPGSLPCGRTGWGAPRSPPSPKRAHSGLAHLRALPGTPPRPMSPHTKAGHSGSPRMLPLLGGHKAKLSVARVLSWSTPRAPSSSDVWGGRGDPVPTIPVWLEAKVLILRLYVRLATYGRMISSPQPSECSISSPPCCQEAGRQPRSLIPSPVSCTELLCPSWGGFSLSILPEYSFLEEGFASSTPPCTVVLRTVLAMKFSGNFFSSFLHHFSSRTPVSEGGASWLSP